MKNSLASPSVGPIQEVWRMSSCLAASMLKLQRIREMFQHVGFPSLCRKSAVPDILVVHDQTPMAFTKSDLLPALNTS